MAYGNYPLGYQQYPYQNPVAVQQPQQNVNGMIWVQGEAGAKSYLVGANTTVPLWDSENQTIYLKSADAYGMPSMKIIDYTIREKETQPKPLMDAAGNAYATKEDLEEFKKEIKNEVKNLVKEEIGA